MLPADMHIDAIIEEHESLLIFIAYTALTLGADFQNSDEYRAAVERLTELDEELKLRCITCGQRHPDHLPADCPTIKRMFANLLRRMNYKNN